VCSSDLPKKAIQIAPNQQKVDTNNNPIGNAFLGVLQQIQQQLFSLQMTQQNQAALIQRLTSGTPGHIQVQKPEYQTSTFPAPITVPVAGQGYLVQQA